jgi:stalled ribosome rescue protein Dom34
MVRKVKSWLKSNNPDCHVVINPGQRKNRFYLVVPEYSISQAKILVQNSGFSIPGFYAYDSSLNIRKA